MSGQDIVEYTLDAELGIDFSWHRMAASGPRVVFDAYNDEFARNLYLVDLSTMKLSVAAVASAPDVIWTPDISGSYVAWTEYHYNRPGVVDGPAHWRVLGVDSAGSGDPVVFDSGVHRQLEASAALPATVRVDGDLIAYGIESNSQDRPNGWTIVIKSRRTGQVVRSIDTARVLYQFDIAGGNVVYSEGTRDEEIGFVRDTRLMVSTVDHPAPVEIARNAYDVTAGGDRFAWMEDPRAGAEQTPRAIVPLTMTATFADPRPVQISVLTEAPPPPPDWGNPLLGALWPSADSEGVAWCDRQTDGTWSGELERVVIWDAASSTAYQLEPSAYPGSVHIGDGWLVWISDGDPTIVTHVIHGIPLEQLLNP